MRPDERPAIGIDVGGTNVKLGLVAADGRVLVRRRFAYASIASFAALADLLETSIVAMQHEVGVTAGAVGVAAPGHARRGDGVMVDGTANVPLLHGRSLAAALRVRLGLPVTTLNDGTAATIGEACFGAGRGHARFALLTLGTGVGGGIAIDGRVLTGDDGEPPELGAIVLDAAAAAPRSLEDFASATGFAEAYRRQGGVDRPAPPTLFERAARGDGMAIAAIDATARRIAQGLGTLVNALNLNRCLLAGGIAAAGPALLERVRRELPAFTWPYLLERTRVELASTGGDAGLLGAAASARRSVT